MAQKYLLKAPVVIEKKTRWVGLGYATSQPNGTIRCRILSTPTAPWDGTVVMFPAKQDEEDDVDLQFPLEEDDPNLSY